MPTLTRIKSSARLVALVLTTLTIFGLGYVRFAAEAGSLSVPEAAHATSAREPAGLPPGGRPQTGQPQTGRLLMHDPSGDGRAVVAMGAELEAARHIAIIVPGAGWQADTLLTASPAAEDGPNPISNATALLTQARNLDPTAAVTAIVWLGYDAPDSMGLDAMRSESAVAGGRALTKFVAGLPTNSRVSLLCHSYGAVVCGHATAQSGHAFADPSSRRSDASGTDMADASSADAEVADLVAIGAPGMDVTSRSDLGAAATVWAARTVDDPIRFVPHVRVAGFGHGPDPANPRFGARVIRTGAVHGHSDYFTPASESLTNLARIVLGRSQEVTLDADRN